MLPMQQLGQELDEQNRRVGVMGDHAETVHDNIRRAKLDCISAWWCS